MKVLEKLRIMFNHKIRRYDILKKKRKYAMNKQAQPKQNENNEPKINTNELIARTKVLKAKVEKFIKEPQPVYDEAYFRSEAEEIYKERLETICKHGVSEVRLLHVIYKSELIERFRRISKYLHQNHAKRVSQKVIDTTIEVLKKVTLKMSPDGRITNLYIDGVEKKIYIHTNGYECISYRRTTIRLSRIYMMLYITLPDHLIDHEGIIVVDHIDDNCVNNNINNLQWLTNSQNVKKGYQNGNRKQYNYYTYIVVEDNIEFDSGVKVCEYLGVATLQDYFNGKCKTIGGKTIIRHLRN